MKYQHIIAQMRLEEKVQLLSGQDMWSTKSIKRLGIPSAILSDGPHGIRRQADIGDPLGIHLSLPATCFPTAVTMANSWDEALCEEVGRALGKEAKQLHVDVLLAPGLNIKRHPLCGRNFEYYSEDPYLSGKLAAAFIRGIQESGVSACPKHFAANNQELRRMSNDSIVDARTLREIYLTGFEIAVKEGKPRAIMSAYNRLNECYTNEDSTLLLSILRHEWGFEGFVVTDWGGGNDFVEGIRCGSNLEMPGTGGDSAYQLYKAVASGHISEDIVDQRLDELLGVILTCHSDDKIGQADIDDETRNVHHHLARKAAASSMVLLKNESGILPIEDDRSVAVIGEFAVHPRYQGAGSSRVNPTSMESIMACIDQYGLNVSGYSDGYRRDDQRRDLLIRDAVELAKSSDVILLCIGLEEIMESEGQDRVHMRLHEKQVQLLDALYEVNKNIIVYLSGGSAVVMPWLDKCKAVLQGYLGGQAGSLALLDIVTGAVNPSGKLAETFWLKQQDVPSDPFWQKKQRTSEYREGLYVGYRAYTTTNRPVLFPFGYGLSYTSFSYTDIEANAQAVSFTVTNSGSRSGREIAQLYVGKKDSGVFRPARELKGYASVELETGESRRLSIEFDDKAFRYFDVDKNSWVVEAGTYQIMIGSNALQIQLICEIEVEGVQLQSPYKQAQIPHYFSGQVESVTEFEFECLLGRAVPAGAWDEQAPLEMNDALSQMYYAKSWIARLVYRGLIGWFNRSKKKREPDLNILFIYHITFRGIAKMLGGVIGMEMARGILHIANGEVGHGLRRLAKGFEIRRRYRRFKNK